MSTKKKQIREKFRSAVFERDGHKCRVCGRAVECDAHHIVDRNELPAGGYVKENGISLCCVPNGPEQSCHEKAEVYHSSGSTSSVPGFLPEDLYKLIGSSYEKALEASKKLEKT